MFSTFIRNKNFLGLLSANTLLSAAMPMLIILGGLAGLALTPSPALATFPASVQMLAGLVSAAPFSWVMGRYGRKTGFVIGGGFAITGGVICAVALMASNFVLLCIGHLFLGAAMACYQYFRFAAVEVVSTQWQPVAISLMLTSGLVAAFVGPQLFIFAKDLLVATPLAGAYLAISVLSFLGLWPLAVVRIETLRPKVASIGLQQVTALGILRNKPILLAIVVGAVSQGAMVLLMVPTPLSMIGHGLNEAMAGDVIRWHVVAMFAPSFFTGFLIKKFGTERVASLGLLLMIASAMIAASGLTPHHFYGSLILLGIGWNFGFIGATNMLANAVSAEQRSTAQGVNDTVIALASATFAFSAGAIVTSFGWTILSLAVIPILFIVLFLLLLVRTH